MEITGIQNLDVHRGHFLSYKASDRQAPFWLLHDFEEPLYDSRYRYDWQTPNPPKKYPIPSGLDYYIIFSDILFLHVAFRICDIKLL